VAATPRATLRLRCTASPETPSSATGFILKHFGARGISQARTSAWPAFFGNRMKNRTLNPGYAFALCYAAMVCLAIAVNLMPIFLTTLRVDLSGRTGLTGEQLGRISAITFAGLVGGILFTGPLADRWGGKTFSVLGTLLIGVGLALLGISPGYSMVCIAKILSGSEINSLHSFLSRSICYDCCSCSATSDYGWACSPAACNRIEACSWKISLSGNSWPC
jgi:MFS family permease